MFRVRVRVSGRVRGLIGMVWFRVSVRVMGLIGMVWVRGLIGMVWVRVRGVLQTANR